MDHLQAENQYTMDEGRMYPVVTREPGTESNRIERIGDRRTRAGSGPIPHGEDLPAHFVLDAGGEATVVGGVSIFGTVRNVFDTVYVASRLPAGLRPGLPRTFLLGVRATV